MGVESYFINLRTTQDMGMQRILGIMEAGPFEITPVVHQYRKFLLQKKETDTTKFVVNKIVLVELIENAISLQACYMCFHSSKAIIGSIIRFLYNCNVIEYAFYCDHIIYPDSFAHIEEIIDGLVSTHYHYFQSTFTKEEANILPNEFFSLYNGKLRFKNR